MIPFDQKLVLTLLQDLSEINQRKNEFLFGKQKLAASIKDKNNVVVEIKLVPRDGEIVVVVVVSSLKPDGTKELIEVQEFKPGNKKGGLKGGTSKDAKNNLTLVPKPELKKEDKKAEEKKIAVEKADREKKVNDEKLAQQKQLRLKQLRKLLWLQLKNLQKQLAEQKSLQDKKQLQLKINLLKKLINDLDNSFKTQNQLRFNHQKALKQKTKTEKDLSKSSSALIKEQILQQQFKDQKQEQNAVVQKQSEIVLKDKSVDAKAKFLKPNHNQERNLKPSRIIPWARHNTTVFFREAQRARQENQQAQNTKSEVLETSDAKDSVNQRKEFTETNTMVAKYIVEARKREDLVARVSPIKPSISSGNNIAVKCGK